MNERNQIIIKLIATHFMLLPIMLLLSVIFKEEACLLLPITQTVLSILFFAGYWEFWGIRLKWIYCLSMELLILGFIIFMKFSPLVELLTSFWLIPLALLQLYLLVVLCKIIVVILINDLEIVEIEFPFKQGSYLITDGGNSKISRLMNYHFYSSVHKKNKTNKSMLYATDIVKLTDGLPQFLPTHNIDYPIFNEKIYSPMDGTIAKVVNTIDDNQPFSGNYPYNTGNTIVIKKDNYYFLLGHLKKGSIVVNEGDSIKINTFIGEVGNSGMSERPHLHMQLMKSDTNNYWKGMGICIQYQNKNLYKNRLIKRK